MTSTLCVRRSVLLAMSQFACSAKDVQDANDYRAGIAVRILDEQTVRFAASNRAALAVANLVAGDDAGLVSSVSMGKSWQEGGEEYILPVVRILQALKGNPEDMLTIDHFTYGKSPDERRGTVKIVCDGDVTISAATIPAMFKHLDLVTRVSRESLTPVTQISVSPAQLMNFVRAAKRMGIPSPERVVIAHSGPNLPLGIKVGLSNWLYGICMPMSSPGYGEGTAPGWLTEEPLNCEEAPEEVEQLALWEEESSPPAPAEDLSGLSDDEVYQRYSNATTEGDTARYAAEYNRRRQASGAVQPEDPAEEQVSNAADEEAAFADMAEDLEAAHTESVPPEALTMEEEPPAEPTLVTIHEHEGETWIQLAIPGYEYIHCSIDDFATLPNLAMLATRIADDDLQRIHAEAVTAELTGLMSIIEVEMGARGSELPDTNAGAETTTDPPRRRGRPGTARTQPVD